MGSKELHLLLRYGSGIEPLPSMHEVLGSNPNYTFSPLPIYLPTYLLR